MSIGVVAAVGGVLLGAGIPVVLKRRAATPKEGARRTQLFIGCVMLAAAALEIVIAATKTRHAHVNAGIAALLGVTGMLTLIRNRPPSPDASERSTRPV